MTQTPEQTNQELILEISEVIGELRSSFLKVNGKPNQVIIDGQVLINFLHKIQKHL